MKILRWVIPVDDEEHIVHCGRIVHVDCRAPDRVTIWTTDTPATPRTFRVFGTGQLIPEDINWEHRGTALSAQIEFMGAVTPRGVLVWHLFEAVPF